METAGSVDWIPGIAMLAAGLIVGLMLMRHALMSSRRAKEVKPNADLDIRDLEAKKDVLLAELRELEDTAAKQTPEQLATERRRLELEAASVLMELDQRRAGGAIEKPAIPGVADVPAAKPQVEAEPPAAAGAGLRAFLWGIGSTAVLIGLGYFAFNSATMREQGGSMTGNPAMQQASAQADAQAQQLAQEQERLKAAVQANPDNLDARLDLAYLSLMQNNMMGVDEQVGYVLARRPDDPRATSYKALVKMAQGDSATAIALLKKAIATDPNMTEAYIHLAIVYAQIGRMDDATAEINDAIKKHPEQSAQLTGILNEIRAEMSQSQMGGGAAPAQAAAGGQGGGGITGSISLDPSVSVAPGTVIYILARPAGTAGGPPVAVKRLTASSFPMQFDLGSADSMMGQALPAQLRLEVRADSDGDAMTRSSADAIAIADPVSSTASGVKLTLKH